MTANLWSRSGNNDNSVPMNTYIKSLSVLVLALGSALAPSRSLAQTVPPAIKNAIPLELNTNQVVHIEVIPPQKPELATFALLPGINRALLSSDSAVQRIKALGYGVIILGFSPQPLSITLLNDQKIPYFLKNQMSLADLARESEAALRWAQQQYSLKTVVPVSLSFSGAVSTSLKDHSLVIDVVPMTSNAATNPEVEQMRQGFLALEFWNPFLKAANRLTLDNLYRFNWSKKVSELAEVFGFDPSQHSLMVEGYTTLSRASEGFEWNEQIDSKDTKTRRVFVLAQNESPSLLESQISAFKKLKTKAPLLVMVEGSGHVLPSERPSAYARILSEVTTGSLKNEKGIMIYTKGGLFEKVSADQGEAFLENVIKSQGQPLKNPSSP